MQYVIRMTYTPNRKSPGSDNRYLNFSQLAVVLRCFHGLPTIGRHPELHDSERGRPPKHFIKNIQRVKG